jgi:hypothetical protein
VLITSRAQGTHSQSRLRTLSPNLYFAYNMDVVKLNIEPGHLWAAGIIWPIVCTVVVGARFATRRAYSRLGWDDWLSLPALVRHKPNIPTHLLLTQLRHRLVCTVYQPLLSMESRQSLWVIRTRITTSITSSIRAVR